MKTRIEPLVLAADIQTAASPDTRVWIYYAAIYISSSHYQCPDWDSHKDGSKGLALDIQGTSTR